jgi:hypothetical protein
LCPHLEYITGGRRDVSIYIVFKEIFQKQ